MKFKKEIRIALVAIIGIVLLFYGLQFLKGMAMFSDNNIYYIHFNDVSGLGVSSPIYSDGYQVGVVKNVKYDYTHKTPTMVEVGLDKKMIVPKGSEAVIESDMLGNVRVSMLLGDPNGGTLEPGSVIEGHVDGGTLSSVAAMLPAVENMLPKLDSIMASINTLLADPSITRSVHNVEALTNELNASTKQFNTLLAELNRDVPGIVSKTDTLLGNTSRLTSNLAAVDVNATVKKLNATLDNMQSLSSQLANNNGTLGKLMRDSKLYDNLNATALAADSLLNNLRANPKRYVHFSIFGKKQ
ncbi:MAG: MCE family protein [Prevotella sp.]|jgi:phospholipid/cholesterol/gamma-HCH transport system substrate-binding protein|nr:MCE family protein [Prevotella sp.]MBQ6162738.1 MCE family protein [Prevotella sp.]MBQ6186684.1 MCE family protein [Prevotella sp.]